MRLLLSGLLSIAGLVMLFGPFDAASHGRGAPAVRADTETSSKQAAAVALSTASPSISVAPSRPLASAEAKLVRVGPLTEAQSLGEAQQVALLLPLRTGDAEGSIGDSASRQQQATPPRMVARAVSTGPAYPKVPVAQRGWAPNSVQGSTSRGTWLSVPNPYGGGNS